MTENAGNERRRMLKEKSVAKDGIRSPRKGIAGSDISWELMKKSFKTKWRRMVGIMNETEIWEKMKKNAVNEWRRMLKEKNVEGDGIRSLRGGIAGSDVAALGPFNCPQTTLGEWISGVCWRSAPHLLLFQEAPFTRGLVCRREASPN